jgi:hypothetical protein
MEDGRLDYAQVLSHQRTETTKSLQLQVRSSLTTGDDTQSSMTFGDCFIGPWCLIAPCDDPDMDDNGDVRTAAEAIVLEMGDELTVLGTRDVRFAKFGGDVKKGEFALFNKFGSRIAFREKTVSLTAGGGYLAFNIESKTFSIVGMPNNPGGAAPYMTITPDSIGMTSESGQSSMVLSGKSATISGGSVAIDSGTVNLGTGANDPVMTLTHMQTYISQLYAFLQAVGAGLTVPLTPPPTLATIQGSTAVKARP